MNLYWSALVVGVLGSFHCIGMCGPIVLAVPAQRLRAKIFYNLGRTITYTAMGAVIGSNVAQSMCILTGIEAAQLNDFPSLYKKGISAPRWTSVITVLISFPLGVIL